MIKLWTEQTKGAYGVRENIEDKHAVKPWFIDTFNGRNVYFVVCPTHQVCMYSFIIRLMQLACTCIKICNCQKVSLMFSLVCFFFFI